ncbi:MAG: pyridoxal phosphate-dependent aminotransferase [Calditrichaeota bacterium]|nr:pyridoxal phosphate-dependent aminotransferase [Calditrichota bacterium]
MPALSSRAHIMPPSPIRKLVPYAEEAKRRGVKIYHLNIGQPDIPTPKVMMDAFRNHDVSVLAYGHSGGLWEYREGLAKYYQDNGIHVTREQVLVTTAGSEAIIFAMLACLDPGDEVLIPEPFYTNYNGFAVEAGVKVVPITCSPESGFALPDDAEIKSRITPRTRAIMICNPNNPTGYVYTREEMERLRKIVLDHDLFFISDEVYREFVYDGKQHVSVLHLDGLDERAIIVDSISKRYSACGARIGCIVTRNSEILDTALRFGQARLCPPTMEQIAGIAALETPQSYFDEVMADYLERRDTVFEALSGIPGVSGLKPSGAFYTVVKLPVDDADRFCTWMLSEFHDNQESVMMAPASGFYATPGLGIDEVRIAFVLNSKEMARAMEILAKGLAAYPGRK